MYNSSHEERITRLERELEVALSRLSKLVDTITRFGNEFEVFSRTVKMVEEDQRELRSISNDTNNHIKIIQVQNTKQTQILERLECVLYGSGAVNGDEGGVVGKIRIYSRRFKLMDKIIITVVLAGCATFGTWIAYRVLYNTQEIKEIQQIDEKR